jgi:hypothetical protein
MTDETNRKPFLDLSVTQLIGGSLAAATAAALGSRLGVVGTIVGAALVSVVSAVAGALYTQSLRRTQELIRAREMLGARERLAKVGAVARRPTLRGATEADTQEIEAAVEDATPSIWSRVTWKGVAAAAGVFFVITALVVTGTELLTGRSLDGESRTTVGDVFKGGSSGTSDQSPTKQAPTTDPTGGTSEAPTTDPTTDPTTGTFVHPTTDPTAVPTVPTPTPSVTPSPSTTPSPSATATP